MISIGVRTDSMRSHSDKTLQIYVVLFRPCDTILSMATWHLAGSGNTPIHQAAARTRSDTNFQEEYLAFSKKSTAHISTKKYLWD
jgi:hypothetical protein